MKVSLTAAVAMTIGLSAFTSMGSPRIPRTHPRAMTPGSFQHRYGVHAAEHLLRGTHRDQRRGLERLAHLPGERAVAAILETLAKSKTDGGLRLEAVRALAAHCRTPAARDGLRGVLVSDARAVADQRGTLLAMVAPAAALALSACRDSRATEILLQAAEQDGQVAALAGDALVAHPPARLGPIAAGGRGASLALIETLERLGDQRAFHRLRDTVRGGAPPVAARAAIALTRLGDGETLELARRWSRDATTPLVERLAAARILCAGGDVAPLTALAKEDLDEALAMAAKDCRQAFPPAFQKALTSRSSRRRALAALALVRAPDGAGLDALMKALEDGGPGAFEAARALATAPTAAGRLQTMAASSTGAPRRLAALALISMAETSRPGTVVPDAVARDLTASRQESDRYVGVLVRALRSGEACAAALGTDGAEGAASRAAAILAAPRHAACGAAAVARLPRAQAAEAAALLDVIDRAGLADEVPERHLLLQLDAGGPGALVAARLLAGRDRPSLRRRLRTLLTAPNPGLRQQVALGLAASRWHSVVGLAAARYRLEANADVRQALIQGVAQRRGPATARLLQLAGRLDPSSEVRRVARAASRRLIGRRRLRSGRHPWAAGSVWVATGGAIATTPARAAHVLVATSSDGAARLFLPAPGQVSLLVGISSPAASVRLAPAPTLRFPAAR